MTNRRTIRRRLRPARPPAARTAASVISAVGLALLATACSSPSSTGGITGGASANSPSASAPASAKAGSNPRLPSKSADCLTQAPPTCYTPRVFDTAYGIQPLLDRGIDGRGETVVLPEAAETSSAQNAAGLTDIRQDLAAFDSRFGLPPARIGVITTLAGSSASPWLAGLEEVNDTEMVHAVAPDATIRELLVDPADVTSPAKLAATFAAYVRIAVRQHADVISQSGIANGGVPTGEHLFTSSEVATVNSALEYAAARHVTFVVGSGDEGVLGNHTTAPVREVILPASDPLVLAVGGTSLTANPVTGAYISETAWNTPAGPGKGGGPKAPEDVVSEASGGGFSQLFARPGYQDGVPGIAAMRGVPDVAADASPDTGMAEVRTWPGGTDELLPASGTSAAAPFWAGLIALADQDAGHPLGFVNPAIYQIARGPLYHKAFHDITTGSNTATFNGVTITGYQAGPGWDPVTGWGSPDAQVLIPLLAR